MLKIHSIFDTQKVKDICNPKLRNSVNELSNVQPVPFVGQEQDATLLFTWDDFPPGVQDGSLVTYLGSYNPYKNEIHAVFVHNEKTDIVNATINRSHTFIGFVTHEFVNKTGPQGKLHQQRVYKAFIAEIRPQNRVFYLNLERENCMKLQFLYGSHRNPGNLSGPSREDHLLVILHKESIGLYHLPIARVGEEGVIMSGEPRKEQIFHRRFVWIEWDAINQRLYIVHFLKSGKNERGQTVHQPQLKCYQFLQYDVSNYPQHKDKELVLDMHLDLPIPYLKDSSGVSIGPYSGIPDAAINMQILSLPNGSLCLCYQHHITSSKSKMDTSGKSSIQYSVCLIHKDQVLHCECSNIEHNAAVNGRLFFSWIDGYIAVHLPGHLTHLLCVGVECDVGLHIIHHENGDGDLEHLIPFPPERIGVMNTDPCFYNVNLHEAFQFSIDHTALLKLFEKDIDLHSKMCVLHYATVQNNDLNLAKMLIKSVSRSPTDLNTVSLLKEFLIGSTYTQLRRQVFAIEKKMLKFLPYTSQMCGYKQVLSYSGIQCSIWYTALPEVTLLAEKQSANDFWQLLATHMEVVRLTQNCRFDLNFAKLEADEGEEEESEKTVIPDTTNPSLFQKLSAAARGAFNKDPKKSQGASHNNPPQRLIRSQSKTEIVLGRPPAFLSNKDDDTFYKTSRYFCKTVELLSLHLIKFNQYDSRTKMRSIAEEYVKCQMLSSRLLCHMIWSVMSSANKIEDDNLSRRGSKQEIEFIMMLERLMVAVEQLGFPLPSGLQNHMLHLSFRCTMLPKFLQYVDQGVYTLTPQFVLQVIEDLPDTPDNVQTKWHLLHRLPQDNMCLAHWDHPSAMQCIGQQYSEMVITKQVGWDILFKEKKPGTAPHTTHHDNYTEHETFPPAVTFVKYLQKKGTAPHTTHHDNYTEHETFPPAVTFVKYLQKKDFGLKSAEGSTGVELDTDYLKRAAMAYMNTPMQL